MVAGTTAYLGLAGTSFVQTPEFLTVNVWGGLSIIELIVLILYLSITATLTAGLPRLLTDWYKKAHIQLVRNSVMKDAKRRGKSPKKMAAVLERVDRLEGEKAEKSLAPLRKVIRYVVIISMGYIILWLLDKSLDQAIFGEGKASFIIFFLVEVVIIVLLLQYGVKTIADVVVQSVVGSDVRVRERMRISKDFKTSLSWFLGLLLILLTLAFLNEMIGNRPLSSVMPGVLFDVDTKPSVVFRPLMVFVFIIALTMLISGIILVVLKASIMHPRRMEMHVAKPMEKVLRYVFIMIGFAIALGVLGIDPFSITIIVTVVGFVLGFGLQFQIANIIAGLTIAIDRPYTIGDRIRVGREAMGTETWGDVEDISLQSTRIVTTENELVTVPNYLLATNPVWNFTRGEKKLALNIKIGISYGSDWRVAEKIILEKVSSHPKVLKDPPPFMRIDEFGESSQKFIIWAWIADARHMLQVRSDLLGAIKDGFDEGGVEIPFPYRTVVFKKDIPKEVRMSPEEKRKYIQVRMYDPDFEVHREDEAHMASELHSTFASPEVKHILVPTSGTTTAGMLAEYSMNMANNINANVIALWIKNRASKSREKDGVEALEIFTRVGRAHGVSTSVKIRKGPIVDTVLEEIEESRIDLVVIGSGQKGILHKLGKVDLSTEISRRSKVPVVIMPYRPELMDFKK